MVADFAISTLSSLLLSLLSYTMEAVKLALSLATHLLKLYAAAIDGLCACLDEIFPPDRRIQTLRCYLIAKQNELEPAVKGYLVHLLAKCDEIYPPTKQYVLIKLEESIQLLGWCFEYVMNKFDDAFPPGERIEALYNYIETGKQYMAVKSDDWTAALKGFAGYVMRKFNEAFPAKEETVVALHGWWKTAKLLVVVCTTVWITLFCCRMCCCGRRSRTMKAPGRDGERMRRSDFERNPRGYFRNLRSNR